VHVNIRCKSGIFSKCCYHRFKGLIRRYASELRDLGFKWEVQKWQPVSPMKHVPNEQDVEASDTLQTENFLHTVFAVAKSNRTMSVVVITLVLCRTNCCRVVSTGFVSGGVLRVVTVNLRTSVRSVEKSR
jgi:hypothetical protein